MSNYALTNDFHGTTAIVRCEGLSHIHNEVEISLTDSQKRSLKNRLCGVKGCRCSGDDGLSGTQIVRGRRVIVTA